MLHHTLGEVKQRTYSPAVTVCSGLHRGGEKAGEKQSGTYRHRLPRKLLYSKIALNMEN